MGTGIEAVILNSKPEIEALEHLGSAGWRAMYEIYGSSFFE